MIGKKINQLATELAPVSTDLTIIGDPISGVSKKITLAQLGAIFSGAVSFYNDFASFPATGDINVIYCAKDTKKLYLWSGSAYVEVFPSQALLDTYQLRSEKGNANGYASLDSSGKVPISQLPSSIMEYKGTWNAATNTPTLANGTGDTGDVYLCNAAGTVNFGAGPLTFAVGDYVVYSGTIWQRSSGAVGTVTSVAASITGDAIGITGSPVTTSGTLAFAFAGTGAQYIKGDGTLATFPNTIAQATNLIAEVYNSTGATLTKGTIVYINGGQGNLPTVTKAIATGDSTSAQTFGIVQADITNNNNGFVVVSGRLENIATDSFSVGAAIYLSGTTAGAFTSTKPYAPTHLVYIGVIVRSHPTQGVIEVKIQNGYELDELHNVAAQTPSNNDGLFYESSTSLWKNKSIATILGYTPQAQLNGTGFVKASGTTISYDNSTYLTTSAAATTYLPMVLSSTAKDIDLNGQTFDVSSKTSPFTSGRLIIDPTYSAIGYQNAGVFDGLKILTNGNAEFSNSGVTRFFNQVRFDSTLTNGTYTYTLPGATGTLALTSDLTGGTVTSVGLSSATSGVTIGSTPITTSGTITLAIATASGSQQGLLSSTDWTTFNSKQNALTNPVTGTGTTNYLPKFTGTSTIGNSAVTDDGSLVEITSRILRITSGTTSEFAFGVSLNSTFAFGSTNGKRTSAITYNTGDKPGLQFGYDATDNTGIIAGATEVNGSGIDFYTYNGSSWGNRLRLNKEGNLGLGVTPSAWAGRVAMQISPKLALWGDVNQSIISHNIYTDPSDKYIANGAASIYTQSNGSHIWLSAPSGTAGNAISFTQAMTLASTGNLTLGTTSSYSGVRFVSEFTTGVAAWFITGGDSVPVSLINNGGAISTIGFKGTSTANAFNVRVGADGENFIAYTSNTERFRIASTGAATFSSSVTATQFFADVTSGTNQLVLKTGGIDRGYIQASNASLILNTLTGNDMQFHSNSTERMRLTASGELCVGRTSAYGAGFLVNVQGNIYASAAIVAGSSVTAASGLTVGSLGSGSDAVISLATNASGAPRTIYYKSSTAAINFTSTGGSDLMTLTNGGNVGIGTTSPAKTLTVVNTAEQLRLSYGGSNFTDFRNDSAGGLLINTNAGYIINYIGGTERLRIKTNTINISSIPTSSAGLSSGDLYSSAGVLMIV